MRYLAAQAPAAAAQSTVQLRGCFSSFMLGGGRHFCMVLERLHGSLTDFVAEADPAARGLPLAQLRKIAFQLLVGAYAQSNGHVPLGRWHDKLAVCSPAACWHRPS